MEYPLTIFFPCIVTTVSMLAHLAEQLAGVLVFKLLWSFGLLGDRYLFNTVHWRLTKRHTMLRIFECFKTNVLTYCTFNKATFSSDDNRCILRLYFSKCVHLFCSPLHFFHACDYKPAQMGSVITTGTTIGPQNTYQRKILFFAYWLCIHMQI